MKPISPDTSVLTVGQIAQVCRVSPRQAAMWIDRGLLPGYRLPGGSDRRATREAVLTFIKTQGLPEEFAKPLTESPTGHAATVR